MSTEESSPDAARGSVDELSAPICAASLSSTSSETIRKDVSESTRSQPSSSDKLLNDSSVSAFKALSGAPAKRRSVPVAKASSKPGVNSVTFLASKVGYFVNAVAFH